jgi:hypothetical protein
MTVGFAGRWLVEPGSDQAHTAACRKRGALRFRRLDQDGRPGTSPGRPSLRP